MKNRLFTISILALLLLLVGCSNISEQEAQQSNDNTGEPLLVCIDMENYSDLPWTESAEVSAQATIEYIAEYAAAVEDGGPIEIEFEILPKGNTKETKTQRKSMLTRLHTEIMAGEGPDVYIIAAPSLYYMAADYALFPDAQKAMENGLFLPLDEYIENAQFMEWDKLMPEIMEAGRNEYGQQILPLSYRFPVTFYRESEVQHTPSKEITWKDMLKDESNVLTVATFFDDGDGNGEFFHGFSADFEDSYFEYILGGLADYEKEELLFTEEELLQRTMELIGVIEKDQAGEFKSVPAYYKNVMQPEFNKNTLFREVLDEEFFGGIGENENLTMVPLYSDDGGITALITCYAAINANTEQPEKAFYVLDHLLSTDIQQAKGLYTYACYKGAPVHMDLMQPVYPVNHSGVKWNMSSHNFEKYCELRDQITEVRFSSGLDLELEEMFMDCYIAYTEPGEETVEEIVHESYREMKRLLAE